MRLVRNPAAEYDFTGEYHVEQSIDKEEKKVLDASVHGYCTVMSMSINDWALNSRIVSQLLAIVLLYYLFLKFTVSRNTFSQNECTAT